MSHLDVLCKGSADVQPTISLGYRNVYLNASQAIKSSNSTNRKQTKLSEPFFFCYVLRLFIVYPAADNYTSTPH